MRLDKRFVKGSCYIHGDWFVSIQMLPGDGEHALEDECPACKQMAAADTQENEETWEEGYAAAEKHARPLVEAAREMVAQFSRLALCDALRDALRDYDRR